VVDDATDAAESLVRLLALQGHKVLVAHDGLAGLDLALRAEPEIVFLALRLPGMDGFEVAHLLRGRYASDRMLLVATTSPDQREDPRRIQQSGFDHHLVKPLDPSEVQALLTASASA
jgi:DNA-binding response OmpR family regulator